MKKKIIQIDESLCNGCGKCTTACAMEAIKIIDGKAKLVSEQYCDGLGNCLDHCPTGALKIVERESGSCKKQQERTPCECKTADKYHVDKKNSNLQNWPIQLSLVPAKADFLKNKELIVAADCTAFALSNIKELLPDNSALLIGCPKLDNAHNYIEKLTQILRNASLTQITVVRMEVPCCSALSAITQSAISLANKLSLSFEEKIISINGTVLES